jgi:hypothetical protein
LVCRRLKVFGSASELPMPELGTGGAGASSTGMEQSASSGTEQSTERDSG